MRDSDALGQRMDELRSEGLQWTAVADRIDTEFGEALTAEGCRGIWKRWRARNGIAGGGGPEQDEPPTYEERVAEGAAKLERQDEERLLKRLLTAESRTQQMADAMVRAVKALPEIQIITPSKIKPLFPPQEALLAISDSHIGERVDYEETGGLGEYSLEIFRRRADNLLRQVRENVVALRQTQELKRIHVVFDGDITDGWDIFRGHKDHIEVDVVEQVLEAARVFSVTLTELQNDFEQIEVYGLCGNHGRIGRKGENRHHVSWDRLTYKFLEANTQNQPRIQWHIPKAWWAIIDILGWPFLASHGDQIKSWNGIPYYGIDRFDSRQTKLLGAHEIRYVYALLAHFHSASVLDAVNGEKIINGAWSGSSDFSLHQLQTASVPAQWFMTVSESGGIKWRDKILLDTA